MLSNGLRIKSTSDAWNMYPNASDPVKSNQVGTIWVNNSGELQYTDLTGIDYNISNPTGFGVTLQNSYNNSNPPNINTTNGAVVFQGGTGNDSDDVVMIKNNINENVLSAKGNGQILLHDGNYIYSSTANLLLVSSDSNSSIVFGAGNNDSIRFTGDDKSFRVTNDNTITLGSEEHRWKELHIGKKIDVHNINPFDPSISHQSSLSYSGISDKQIDLNLISTVEGTPEFDIPPNFVANPLNQDLNTHTLTNVDGLWKIIGSSYEPASNKFVWKAFDEGNLSTFFNSAQNTYDPVSGEYIIDEVNFTSARTILYGGATVYHGEYIQVEFPSIYEIKSYKLGMRNDAGWTTFGQYTYPKEFKMFTSVDGTDGSWVQVDVRENIQFNLNQEINFTLPTKVKSQYWRLAVNKIKGSNDVSITNTAFLSIANFRFVVGEECPSNGCVKLQSKTHVQGELKVSNSGNFGGSVKIQGDITCNIALSRNTFSNNTNITSFNEINTYVPFQAFRSNLFNDFTSATIEGEVTYIGEIGKIFHVTSSWTWVSNSNQSHIYNMALFKNNTLIPFTEIGSALDSSDVNPSTSSLSTIVTLFPQDSIILKVKCETSTQPILIKDFQLVVVEIASPSVLPSGIQF